MQQTGLDIPIIVGTKGHLALSSLALLTRCVPFACCSLLQVVAEVVAADDVTEVDRLAEYQARPIKPQQGPGGPPSGPDAGPPAPVMASRDSTSQLNPRVSIATLL
jgi:hypothetical protein